MLQDDSGGGGDKKQQQVFLQAESPSGGVQQPWQEAGVFQLPRKTHRVRNSVGDARSAPHSHAGMDMATRDPQKLIKR